ncbi:MAG: hypothetical protein VX764_03215 [Planctomycetota bacterium]|nr:hypothetical protein [Planctomycetota bacterium]
MQDTCRRLDLPELLKRVAGFASSRVGKEHQIRMTPTTSMEQARAWLDETEELRVRLAAGLRLQIEDIADLKSVIGEDAVKSKGVLDGISLVSVWKVLDRSRGLKTSLPGEDSPRLTERSERLQDLPELRQALENSLAATGEILDGASEELAKLRKESQSTTRKIRNWFDENADRSPWRKALQGNVVTPRHGRLCWAVRAECRNLVRGVIHGESSSGQTLFVEPEPVVRWGDQVQRIDDAELQEIRRILAELTRQVHLRRELILQLWNELVELDAAQARARFADALGCIAPELEEGRELELKGARHPLLMWREHGQDANQSMDLEEVRRAVVPLDIALTPSCYQVIVTGPNTGGKTVVLKTVGLLSLMVACGIPIPANKGTRIPIFEKILADIGDEQSLQQDLSTFSSHVTIVSEILQTCSSKSLVLLDELGSGTDPQEGAPLAEAVLDKLYERGTLTVVTTHLGRLKEYAYRRKKCENASMEFDPDLLAPTFRLLVGLPGRSNALVIAERIGMPVDVVERARERSQEDSVIDSEVIDAMQRSQKDLERRVREAENHLELARNHQQEAARQEQEAQRIRGATEYELERLEEDRIAAAVKKIGEALDQIGELTGDRGHALSSAREVLQVSLDETRLSQRRLETARGLSKGDPVFVPRLQQVCEVKKINKEKQRLVVDLNGVATEVDFSDISWVLPPPGFQSWWACDEGK